MITLLKTAICLLLLYSCNNKSHNDIFIEAESLKNKGGWVLDNQSFEQMGSPYLMAHGLGVSVEDASGEFTVPETGNYFIWIRTRDWVKRWASKEAIGRFQILINNEPINTIFGTNGDLWDWQKGDKISLQKGINTIALCDLTGFNGRVDAIYLTTDKNYTPPNDLKELTTFRKNKLGLAQKTINAGKYDLVVVGGGIAGCATAITAARKGLSVALIQNRGILGGNNSSEVRVGLSGNIFQKPYKNIGNLLDELGGVGYWNNVEITKDPTSKRSKQMAEIFKLHPEKLIHNAGPASNYEDDKKLKLIEKHDNIKLFLNMHVFDIKMNGNKIDAVIGKHIENSKEYIFSGTQFVDCTGDATLGYLAGAEYKMGRESKSETGEERAPEVADSLVMGTSVQWNSSKKASPSKFPYCPWAINFTEESCHHISVGDWDWEAGMMHDQITEIEHIRDYALRAVFGNWTFIKNKSTRKAEYENMKLDWVAYIGGKRESRRLVGDIILTEHDILNHKIYNDASFTTTWGIDLHYPKKNIHLDVEPYLSYADIKEIKPYPVPYRCLYSANIDNLFMAGRNISVTHVALGTVRVMRTTGMMGEVVGLAASICKTHNATPRDVYSKHLSELKELMKISVGITVFLTTLKNRDFTIHCKLFLHNKSNKNKL